MCVSPFPASFSSFWAAVRCADKHIVNIMKVYIERNSTPVELIRFRRNIDFIDVYFHEARNSMEYRPPNVNLDSCWQTVSIVTGDTGWYSHLVDIVHTFATDVGVYDGKPFQHSLYVCSCAHCSHGKSLQQVHVR